MLSSRSSLRLTVDRPPLPSSSWLLTHCVSTIGQISNKTPRFHFIFPKRKECDIQSALIFLFSNQSVLRNPLQVRKVKFSSERVQVFSMKTLKIFQTSLIGFVHRVSSELRIWNSSPARHIYLSLHKALSKYPVGHLAIVKLRTLFLYRMETFFETYKLTWINYCVSMLNSFRINFEERGRGFDYMYMREIMR